MRFTRAPTGRRNTRRGRIQQACSDSRSAQCQRRHEPIWAGIKARRMSPLGRSWASYYRTRSCSKMAYSATAIQTRPTRSMIVTARGSAWQAPGAASGRPDYRRPRPACKKKGAGPTAAAPPGSHRRLTWRADRLPEDRPCVRWGLHTGHCASYMTTFPVAYTALGAPVHFTDVHKETWPARGSPTHRSMLPGWTAPEPHARCNPVFGLVLSIGSTVEVVLGWDLPLANWQASCRAVAKSAACPAQMDCAAYYRNQSAVTAQPGPGVSWGSPTVRWTTCPPAGWVSPSMQRAMPNNLPMTPVPPSPQGGLPKPSGEGR
jgi:hypothetical protein